MQPPIINKPPKLTTKIMQISTKTIDTPTAAERLRVSAPEIAIAAKKLKLSAPFSESELAEIEAELFTSDEPENDQPAPAAAEFAAPLVNAQTSPVTTTEPATPSGGGLIAGWVDEIEPDLIAAIAKEINRRRPSILNKAVALAGGGE